MTEFQIFMDHWLIYRPEKNEYVLNGKAEEFQAALLRYLQQNIKSVVRIEELP